MFKLLLKWLLSYFTADKVGILVRLLLSKAGTAIGKELFSIENQKKALEFVKELNENKDLSSKEKADLFNEKMVEWAVSIGKTIPLVIINCLREMAVVSLKS